MYLLADALMALIFGTVQLRPARATDAPSAAENEAEWFRHNVDTEALPHLDRTLRAGLGPAAPDEDFADQLDLLITGIAARATR